MPGTPLHAVVAALLVATLLPGCSMPAAAPTACASQTRTHYLAANEVAWDYAPQAKDAITGKPFSDEASVFVGPGPERIGSVYRKAIFQEYTDASFATLMPRPAQWQHLGLLGPVLHAEVGDTLSVVLRNHASFPVSIHAHGVRYDKANEGAPYADGNASAGDAVAPGGQYTYTWKATERSGPGPHEGSSAMWMYHSHVDEVADTNAGLVGAIIVTRCGEARADGSPSDVDREIVALFTVMNENESPLLDASLAAQGMKAADVDHDDPDFQESNLMHSINGYVFGNLPGVKLHAGERVRWYVMALGTEVDLHTPHWHGQTLLEMGMRTDATQLMPGIMKTLDMVPDETGTWLFHCHVNDHIKAGMQAFYTVEA